MLMMVVRGFAITLRRAREEKARLMVNVAPELPEDTSEKTTKVRTGVNTGEM